MSARSLASGLAVLLACVATTGVSATNILIQNTDPPGQGFNDPTPVAPVGGNMGTTRGEQRMIAFEFAAQLWGTIVLGNQDIRVRGSFAPLTCSSGSAVLGSASPVTIHANFSGAPEGDTWYVAALANALANADLDSSQSDLRASFNGDIDDNNACLNGRNWYYGLDNNPTGNDIDFLNVIMHELGHGLGFVSLVDLGSGALPSNRPSVFERLAVDTNQGLALADMNNVQRRNALTSTGGLVWTGAETTARAADYLTAGTDVGGLVRLFAPGTVQPGSSVSHFDTVATPNVLMEPSLTSTLTAAINVDLTSNYMADIGWDVPDSDRDLVTDINDNCVLDANATQLDSDGDGFGNLCDADLNNDSVVNAVDLGILKTLFFGGPGIADLNGDGVVNALDLGIVKSSFFGAPGPSGYRLP